VGECTGRRTSTQGGCQVLAGKYLGSMALRCAHAPPSTVCTIYLGYEGDVIWCVLRTLVSCVLS
jgi:hypothetical protein